MSDRLYTALEVCLQALKSGVSLEQCLHLYPDLTQELKPVLEGAFLARAIGDDTVPNAALHRSRTRVIIKAAALRGKKPNRSLFRIMPRLALVALFLALAIFLGWSGLFVASAKALPGDPLYSVKRVTENVSLQIAPSNQLKRNIEARYQQRRIEEVSELLELGRNEKVRFLGVVNHKDASRWNIDNISVMLTPVTKVTGNIEAGVVVEVNGETQTNGYVTADSIALDSFEFIGLVESITSKKWVVSGTELKVLRSSQLDPAIRVGDSVIVLVQVDGDAPIRARAILRLLSTNIIPLTSHDEGPGSEIVESPVADNKEIDFTAVVEEISLSSWKIGGRVVSIDAETELKGDISVGDLVKVHALVGSDGNLLARQIMLEQKNVSDENNNSKDDKGNGDQSNDNGEGSNDNGSSQDEGDGNKKEDDEGTGGDDSGKENDDGGSDDSSDDGGESSDDKSGDEDNGDGHQEEESEMTRRDVSD